jgi:hypothetical protein
MSIDPHHPRQVEFLSALDLEPSMLAGFHATEDDRKVAASHSIAGDQ